MKIKTLKSYQEQAVSSGLGVFRCAKDGFAVELGMEDFVDFEQAVEPLGELRPREAALPQPR